MHKGDGFFSKISQKKPISFPKGFGSDHGPAAQFLETQLDYKKKQLNKENLTSVDSVS